MNHFVLLSAIGFVLLMPTVSQAESPAGSIEPTYPPPTRPGVLLPKPYPIIVRSGDKTQSRDVVTCYDCGGSYPHFQGAVTMGSADWVWEYGPDCGGAMTWRWDNRPNICRR
jgi:hypothetical protein